MTSNNFTHDTINFIFKVVNNNLGVILSKEDIENIYGDNDLLIKEINSANFNKRVVTTAVVNIMFNKIMLCDIPSYGDAMNMGNDRHNDLMERFYVASRKYGFNVIGGVSPFAETRENIVKAKGIIKYQKHVAEV